MKNSFRTLPVAAALALAAAGGDAWAQASGVTLYGRLDLNLTQFSGPAPLEMTTSSTSRWGVRGSEDLGGGWRAVFQLESRINADTGTPETKYWGRESWVGVRGPWGTLRLGRSLTPSQRIASNYDPHGTDGIGSFGSTGLLLGHAVLPRMDNTVYYETPNWSGFSVFAAHQLDETTNGVDDSVSSVRLRLQRGALDLSLGHAAISAGNKVSSLAGAYDLKWIKPMLQFHRGQRAGRDRGAVLLGFTAPSGSGEWRAAWSKQDDRSSSNVDRTLLALGYDHPLSKRTTLYGTVVRDRSSGQSALTGTEFGLRHNF